MLSTLTYSCPFIFTTCQSTAIAIEDESANEAKTNARTDQRFTRRGMPALWYQKPYQSQGVRAPPSAHAYSAASQSVAPCGAFKVSIDLALFRAKHRKCFFPFDVPSAV